jgi:FkbM family methyltransferase
MYYGQFNPQVDCVLHQRYFPNKFNGTSLECGAFDGLLDSSTKFFEENYNWKTINIEPFPHIFKNLEKNRPASINIEIALSNKEEIAIFKNYKHPTLGYNWGNGSMNHTNEHLKELDQLCGKNNCVELAINCKTYSQIIKELNIEKLDLFVLDVEGNELNVIDGMIGCDVLPDVFVIEHGHRNIEFFEDYLKKLNVEYKLDHVSFVNSFFIKV